MRSSTLLAAGLALATLSCVSEETPTGPNTGDGPAPDAPALATAPGSWAPRAAPRFGEGIYGYDLGTATYTAGESIVYTFGGTSADDGGTGFRVQAYNGATDAWSGKISEVGVFHSNGVGKIGGRLYFSGGYTTRPGACRTPPTGYGPTTTPAIG